MVGNSVLESFPVSECDVIIVIEILVDTGWLDDCKFIETTRLRSTEFKIELSCDGGIAHESIAAIGVE